MRDSSFEFFNIFLKLNMFLIQQLIINIFRERERERERGNVFGIHAYALSLGPIQFWAFFH